VQFCFQALAAYKKEIANTETNYGLSVKAVDLILTEILITRQYEWICSGIEPLLENYDEEYDPTYIIKGYKKPIEELLLINYFKLICLGIEPNFENCDKSSIPKIKKCLKI
jgi:hypothetical protein